MATIPADGCSRDAAAGGFETPEEATACVIRAADVPSGRGNRVLFAKSSTICRRAHIPLGLPGRSTGPFLLFVGRLSAQKGLDLLLAAFKRLRAERPDLQLVLMGPDFRGYEAESDKSPPTSEWPIGCFLPEF